MALHGHRPAAGVSTARDVTAARAVIGVVLMSLIAAASPSPSPVLSAYLAPVSDTWVEEAARPDVLDGPFTSHDYGVLVQDTDVGKTLDRYGFVAGFAHTWRQKITQDYLVERVFEFDSSSGPKDTLNWFETGAKTSKYFKRDLTALSQTTSSGVEELFENDYHGFRFYFVKGNLFFVVHLETDRGEDLSDAARGIAQTEFDLAPNEVNVPPAPPPPPPSPVAVALAIGFVALVVVLGVALLLRSSRRRTAPPLAYAAVQLSPDGNYWWDGARWRLVATDPPPPRIG